MNSFRKEMHTRFSSSSNDPVKTAEKNLHELKHVEALVKKKLEEEVSAQRKRKNEKGIWWGTQKNTPLKELKLKLEQATQAVEIAQKEFDHERRLKIESNLGMKFHALPSPAAETTICACSCSFGEGCSGSPFFRGENRGATKMERANCLCDWLWGSQYPRTLFLTLIGASQLPRLHALGWCDAYGVVTNLTTQQSGKTAIVNNSLDPEWDHAFIFEIRAPTDIIVVEVFNHDIIGTDDFIGAAILPLDSRFLVNREIGLEIIKKKDQSSNGILRVAAVWADEAQPHLERGRFLYRVVFPHGIKVRATPHSNGKKTGTTLLPGEMFEASARLKPVDENITYVRINTSTDRWLRCGWVFENIFLYDENGEITQELNVLERIQPPSQTVGDFFYRVLTPLQLPLEMNDKSPRLSTFYEKDLILECSEKLTPVDSKLRYAKVDGLQGYVVENLFGDILHRNSNGPMLEHCSCPEAIDTEDAEYGHFLFKVVCSEGVHVRDEPSPASKRSKRFLLTGQVVVADCVKTRFYPGIGTCQFARRATYNRLTSRNGTRPKPGYPNMLHLYWDRELSNHFSPITFSSSSNRLQNEEDEGGGWIRLEKQGLKILTEIEDLVETGNFKYKIVYANGVAIREFPTMEFKPTHPVIPFGEIVEVQQKLVKADDYIFKGNKAPTFLHIQKGWIIDSKDDVVVCLPSEDSLNSNDSITSDVAL